MVYARLGIWLVALGLLATACGLRQGHGWFGWASVPACQSAIRAKALSEFGRKSDIDFQGVANEKRLENGRVRVTGRVIVERKSETIKLSYECLTNPRQSRLVSATYDAAD
jgi:hypothetical protein